MPALPPANNVPDVQVLVVAMAPAPDVVNVTYPGIVGGSQLQSDLGQLGQVLSVDPRFAHITNKSLPMNGVVTPAMTSVTLEAPGAVPTDNGMLPVDKLIIGLHNYRRIAITYIMPPSFRYSGFHNYSDNNVQVSVVPNGSTLSFSVTVLNPNLNELTLPASDVAGTNVAPAQTRVDGTKIVWFRAAGFMLAATCAILIGWGVYTALAKLQ